MSNKHYFVCDNCGHMEQEKLQERNYLTFSSCYHVRPDKWMSVNNKDICSKKCAKQYADKVKDVNEETSHCCCKGCK